MSTPEGIMDQSDIAIIGAGVVGTNMHDLFPGAQLIDPPRDLTPERKTWRVAFVCVPTPMGEDGACDTSIVEQAITENEADVFVIKSTVPPGTTDRIAQSAGRRIIFSPEWTGATQHSVAIDDGFLILGGRRDFMSPVVELYKSVKPATFRIMKTTAETAELVKYAENAFLATKVSFFDEFYRLCEAIGVDVDEFREALLLDPRIGREHSFAYRDHPWWESKCFDKDLPAVCQWAEAHGVRANLVQAVIDVNSLHKREGS